MDELMYYIYSIEKEGNYYDKLYLSYYGTGYWDIEYEEGVTVRDTAKNYAINSAVMYEILYEKAKEAGYVLTDEEIASSKNYADQVFREMTVQQLQVTGLTKDVLIKVNEKMALGQQYRDFMTEGLGLDKQAITDSVSL
jgi:foldase protein PrsA